MGLKPDEFWSLTPYELYEWCKEADPYRLQIFGAWHSAMFTRQKKMPSLRSVMGYPPEQASPDDLMIKVKQLHAAFGGSTNG